jgi:poly-gamma-glutamate synthesis protein (capsule biosynthesis protein)
MHMTPMQNKNFKANRSSRADALWLRDVINREGKKFGTRAEINQDNTLTLKWE